MPEHAGLKRRWRGIVSASRFAGEFCGNDRVNWAALRGPIHPFGEGRGVAQSEKNAFTKNFGRRVGIPYSQGSYFGAPDLIIVKGFG
jgi:hypothetical protein